MLGSFTLISKFCLLEKGRYINELVLFTELKRATSGREYYTQALVSGNGECWLQDLSSHLLLARSFAFHSVRAPAKGGRERGGGEREGPSHSHCSFP